MATHPNAPQQSSAPEASQATTDLPSQESLGGARLLDRSDIQGALARTIPGERAILFGWICLEKRRQVEVDIRDCRSGRSVETFRLPIYFRTDREAEKATYAANLESWSRHAGASHGA